METLTTILLGYLIWLIVGLTSMSPLYIIRGGEVTSLDDYSLIWKVIICILMGAWILPILFYYKVMCK
jgi:hypothetical protein